MSRAYPAPIVDIVKKFDRAVDVVISGHTHQAYVCEIDGRLVTSGDKYGTIVTTIDLKLDRTTRDIISAKADNVIVRTGAYARDPEQTALFESYDKLAAPIANRRGRIADARRCRASPTMPARARSAISSPMPSSPRPEAPAKGGAVIALTNPGGIRTDIAKKQDGTVSYADLFASQPFRNQLITLTLTGAQIKEALEQQWIEPNRPRILQVSKGFSYTWDATKPYGDRVVADRLSLNGKRIDPATSYRVTVNNYLAVGGDGFTALKQGTAPLVGVYDSDALYGYFQANSPLGPAAGNRITRID